MAYKVLPPVCRTDCANWLELDENKVFGRIVKIVRFLIQTDVPGIDEVSGPFMLEIFLI